MPEPPSTRGDLFIGNMPRKSTATSVVFLDANTFASAHFNGRKMFLVRFDLDQGTHTILDAIDTTFGGTSTETDLMAGDGSGRLVTTNFFQRSCTLYRRDGDRLRFVGDVAFRAGAPVHGVKFYTPDIVAITSRQKAGGVHFVDCHSWQRLFVLRAPGFFVQDVCFPRAGRAVIVSNRGAPHAAPQEAYAAVVHAVDFDMGRRAASLIAEKRFPATHVDNIVFHEGKVFIADQYNNLVLVLDAETLASLGAFEGYHFAHGLDVNFGMLAVTNYGNNTVDIRAL